MDEAGFVQSLTALAELSGIAMSDQQVRMCLDHVELMLAWNRTSNLTRITDLDEILSKHILDSILPSLWLPRKGWALDVGSGGGFPGIPLKIVSPGLNMVLLEAHRKKVSFLRLVAGKLNMDRLWAVQGRAEDIERLELPEKNRLFDLIVMRAVAFEPVIEKMLARALRPGGLFAWWCGDEQGRAGERSSRAGAHTALRFKEEHRYTLPGGRGTRRLLVWEMRVASCGMQEKGYGI